ncbi:LiaF transmembrane domain-containing protein [uncultured Clostridium sp.]|uniref:LiaF transmembrane domain-containing protein n=1 Tax=uncultured Clostridium sp. TaxID=59620 RepID=UPI002600D557|nr:hypothetical protein [uncultured Clostridium sp.]
MTYNKHNRIFMGLIFIFAAIVLLLEKLGFLGHINVWPLILTIFLVIIIVKNIHPLNFSGILFPIAFLCIIYDKQLGIENLTPWTVLLSAALGSIGLSIIFPDKSHRIFASNNYSKDYEFDVIDKEDEDNIVQKTLFSGITKYINSNDFKQADLECTCGGMEIYFDRANIKNGKAIVKIKSTCSGIELFVPKEWDIENHLVTTLSGVETKNKNIPDGSATLVLIGEITLTGVTIIFI